MYDLAPLINPKEPDYYCYKGLPQIKYIRNVLDDMGRYDEPINTYD